MILDSNALQWPSSLSLHRHLVEGILSGDINHVKSTICFAVSFLNNTRARSPDWGRITSFKSIQLTPDLCPYLLLYSALSHSKTLHNLNWPLWPSLHAHATPSRNVRLIWVSWRSLQMKPIMLCSRETGPYWIWNFARKHTGIESSSVFRFWCYSLI